MQQEEQEQWHPYVTGQQEAVAPEQLGRPEAAVLERFERPVVAELEAVGPAPFAGLVPFAGLRQPFAPQRFSGPVELALG